MSDLDVTSSISDRGRDLRITGQIIPPIGTTVGFVLTATAAGSNWQAGGGGGTSDGSVNRKPAGNVTIADGFSLVVEKYYQPGGVLTLQGDAVLGIL